MAYIKDTACAAGITILNEVGLDPGMDHMSAMKVN
jgi:saccharopine dehydrogenase-like NADP-dependent oxidoreductase